MITTPPSSPNLPVGGRPGGDMAAPAVSTPGYKAAAPRNYPLSPTNESNHESHAGVSSLDRFSADLKLYPKISETLEGDMLAKPSLDFLANPEMRLSALPIGHGSYSYVFEILDRGLALKFAASKKKTNIILREANFLSQLNRDNRNNYNNRYHIVPFHGITYICKTHYKRLRRGEFVPGVILPKYEMNLQQFYRGETDENVFANWWKLCSQMLDCLQFLKWERVIHGDIKTANILIASDFDFFLADFTSSKRLTDTDFSIETSLESTMQYCAPEMIEHSKESFDSDLYALGLCLLSLITKNEPFHEIQQSKNHGITSIQQYQWLITAILKNDPISLNILNNQGLYQRWFNEIEFLKLILLRRLPVECCIREMPQFHRTYSH